MNFEDAHFLVRCLRYRLHTEKLPLKTLMLLDLEGATVVDIGANKGIYCFWLSRAVGPTGRVLAFEPQPEMVRYIEARKSGFDLRNVTMFDTALSDAPGLASLARQRVGDGSASLEPDRAGGLPAIQVKLKMLDEVEDVADVRFIKCDVEGHELSAFSGARRVIETYRPVVQFESVGPNSADLFAFFEGLGYLGTMYLDNQYLPYRLGWRIPHPKFGLGGHRDFLFYPPTAIGCTIPQSLHQRLNVAS